MFATLRGVKIVTPTTMPRLSASRMIASSRCAKAGLSLPSASKPLRAAHSSGQPVFVPITVTMNPLMPCAAILSKLRMKRSVTAGLMRAFPPRMPHNLISFPPRYARSFLISNFLVAAGGAGFWPAAGSAASRKAKTAAERSMRGFPPIGTMLRILLFRPFPGPFKKSRQNEAGARHFLAPALPLADELGAWLDPGR